MSILSGLDAAYIERLKERFWAKVDKTPGHGRDGDCWVWTSSLDNHGYGQISVGGRTGRPVRAHIVSFLLADGVLTSKRSFVCHKCDNPLCVNPSHLYAGNHQTNADDRVLRNRMPTGENHHFAKDKSAILGEKNSQAKLTRKEVQMIRELYKPRVVTQSALAIQFGVSPGTIHDILKGKNWAWINTSESK